MGAAEIREPRDHHTLVGDRLFKRCEMDARIAGPVMCESGQWVAIGLRNVLSRDSAIRPSRPTLRSARRPILAVRRPLHLTVGGHACASLGTAPKGPGAHRYSFTSLIWIVVAYW